jgi:hypothetical protein
MHVPSSGEPVRLERWADALHQGPVAVRDVLGRGKTFDRLPHFFSDRYDTDADEPREDLAAMNRATT